MDPSTLPARLCALPERFPGPSATTLELLAAERDVTRRSGLGELLESDPELYQRLRRLASSTSLGVGGPIRSGAEVCRRLGTATIPRLALVTDLARLLESADWISDDTRRALAHRSVVSAAAARSLARRNSLCEETDALLGGALLGLGQLAIALLLPDDYAPLLEQAAPALPLPRAEREALGFDHTDVDAVLASAWGLGPGIASALQHATAPERLSIHHDPERGRVCELFHTAWLAGRTVTETDEGSWAVRLSDALQDRYALPMGGSIDFLRSLGPAVSELTELLGFPTGPTLDIGTSADAAEGAARTLLSERPEPTHVQLRGGWWPEGVGFEPDPRSGLLPQAALDSGLAAALARSATNGRQAPVGLLLVRIDATRDGIGRELADLTREDDLAIAVGDDQLALVTPGTHPVSLRALGHRLAHALDEGAADRGEEPVRIGGAAASRTRRAAEAALLVAEASEALDRALHAPESGPTCRVAGLS